MSAFNIYTTNLADTATLTTSSENALFPATNIADYRRSKVFRSTTNSDNIVFDFGSAKAVDSFFVLADKRNGFGFSTITIQFNATNSWGSPSYQTAVTFSSTHNLGQIDFPSVSYRYCRIVMTSTLGYCELSKIYLGAAAVLTRSIKFGWTIQDADLSLKALNRYGQQFIDKIIRQKKINYAFAHIDKTDKAVLELIFDTNGITTPIWFTIGDSSMSDDYRRTSGAYFLDNIPLITNSFFNKYALSMSATELN
jgi:hypothetical protein